MAGDNGNGGNGGGGGGFGWGLFLGGLAGVVAGAYLASGPGRQQVEQLRSQTIELTGPSSQFGARARRAVQEGVAAARKRRSELEGTPGPAGGGSQGPATPAPEA